MTALLRSLFVSSAAAMLLACGSSFGGEESLGVARQAVNACAEEVPATRAVDGIPAYAQCASIENGAIWSNNGINTASSSQGADWVRTQYSGGYQCTEFARRYFLFHWGIDYQHGNAGEWCNGTLPSTLALATSPTHGDLIVFAPGSCGADSTTGHIAVVDTVDMAGAKVTIVEQNQASRRSTQQSCAKCYLHAVKNDGTSSGGTSSGGTSSGGTSSGGTSSGGASSGGTSSADAGGVGPALGGTPSGGDSPAGAGSTSLSGAATVGGSGSSGANASGAPSSSANDEAPAADDASCSIGRVGVGTERPDAQLLLLGSALLLRLRRRRAARS
jgi:uncharacterized membrane protein YgcG